ncbi:Rad52/Rad22 family DNA repair protein [Pyruvatibacter sp.]
MGFSRTQIKALVAPLKASAVKVRYEDNIRLAYLEGWYVIKEANRVFGFDGWDRRTVTLEQVQVLRRDPLWHATYQAKVQVIVRSHGREILREGIGVGHGHHTDQPRARDMGLKAAETDATKRAFSTFGNRFGLALYDPDLAEVDGCIDGSQSPSWILVSHDGMPIGRYHLPGEFCGAYRSHLNATDSYKTAIRLWALNYPELARLMREVPSLKNQAGMHYGEILQRTYQRRINDWLQFANPPVQVTDKRKPEMEPAQNEHASDAEDTAPASSAGHTPKAGDKPANGTKRGTISTKIDKSKLHIGVPRRIRDKAHLKKVAALSCLVCGRRPSQAHHLTYAQHRGLGQKVSDEFTVPLCAIHHRALHDVGNEEKWWAQHSIDPLPIALGFWKAHKTGEALPQTSINSKGSLESTLPNKECSVAHSDAANEESSSSTQVRPS